MGMEFQFLQQPEMRIEMLPLQEIIDVIERVSPFSDVHIRESRIKKYLKDVNDMLFYEETNKGEFKDHYIVAACTYIFAKPLLHIDFIDDHEKSFVGLVKKLPYDMENPLDIYFVDAESAEQELEIHDKLIEMTEKTIDKHVSFKAGNTLQKKVSEELTKLNNMIRKSYSREAHFSFLGYFDICSRLFKIFLNKKKKDTLSETSDYLKSEKGYYLIQVPLIL